MAGSRSVVIAALIANGAIAVLKFFAYLLTGSPSMLSEVYHSISDTGNQVFLLFGIRYSDRAADQNHPFGYGKAQFFYSFLVSVLLFGIAGWESLKHGYSAVVNPHTAAADPVTILGVGPFPPWYVSVVVLLGAIGFEIYAFAKANAELQRQIKTHGWAGIPEAFRKTSDVTTLTAYTEDAIALAGASLALIGILLTEATGNPIYDAVAAVCIGVLLMGFALALAWENKRLLLGESLDGAVESELRATILADDGVANVDGLRTMFIGPQEVLVTADVSFEPTDTDDLDAVIERLDAALKSADSRVKIVYIEPEA
ncbi:cation diffusion facilitator family transporter [Halonotius terrestris]|uniref:Cation diffusion facilitator family transporter n=1 Tax=Halonotius terrestris TaxID=2487750 RepID=A0A8J8P9V0_9EURY|nr:cation diffusion facilitator family transporter [Halonotius terrestris]TQQ82566.1 cation diffusion facilitator family transporter [Halonotius terrestris]